MTFGSDMRELATELVKGFSEELGPGVFYHKTGTVYDPVTGANVDTWEQQSLYIVTSSLKHDTVYDKSFVKEHFKVTIAGEELLLQYQIDDVVQLPSGTKHRVVATHVDMYQAAINLIVQKSNEV